MSARVHCHSCARDFTPRGYSQHISRSSSACRCTKTVSGPFHLASHSGPLPVVSPAYPSCDSGQGCSPGSEFNRVAVGNDHSELVGKNVMRPRSYILFSDTSSATHSGSVYTSATVKTTSTIHHADLTLTDNDHYLDDMDMDADDLVDADMYEQLDINNPTAYPEQGHSVHVAPLHSGELHTPLPTPPTPPIQSTSVDQPQQALTIDHFPHGRAGAPVPATDQGLSLYHTSQDILGTSMWAPFHSQCDWEIARWAKMRGPTSSAVTDLLGIPEVCWPRAQIIVSLMCVLGRGQARTFLQKY
jgi:hypothetical protein